MKLLSNQATCFILVVVLFATLPPLGFFIAQGIIYLDLTSNLKNSTSEAVSALAAVLVIIILTILVITFLDFDNIKIRKD